mmetsp:Transcript_10965/g.22856  ORF Transcript_10965/g.22856 Transcript_10965/m.22856 type:complete len:215 (-) Transcript_10965:92-736(-)
MERLTLAEDLRLGGDDTILSRIRLHNLELDGAHATADHEDVTLAYGTVRLQEIRFEVHVEQVAADTLDRVVEGQHVNTLAILDIGALVDRHDVSETNAQVGADHLVHADLRLLTSVISEHNAHGVLALLPLDQNCVSTEQLELLHSLEVESDHGVVIVHALVDDQPVGGLLALQDRGGEVLLVALRATGFCCGIGHIGCFLLKFGVVYAKTRAD